jgi:hypothetical protein
MGNNICRSFWLVSLAAGLLAAGCSTPIKTSSKTGIDFTKFKTFALMPLPDRVPVSDPDLLQRVATPARETVKSTLVAKGLREAPAAQADLAVNIRGQSLPQVEVRDYGYNYPAMLYATVNPMNNPYPTRTTYYDRTLTIEMMDNAAKEVVWVGSMTRQSTEPVRVADLEKAIQDILAKYPPAHGGGSK